MIKNEMLIPYHGMESINFDMSLDYVKAICRDKNSFVRQNNIKYSFVHYDRVDNYSGIPWDILKLDECLEISFAGGKMFELKANNDFSGCLENGIAIGRKKEDCLKKDDTLKFDDDLELFVSENGYWLAFDENDIVSDMYIFIKTVENKKEFFSYEWCR